MRRALVLAAAAALGAPAAALASVQQVLLPGPTPYPTPSPPLVTVAAPPTATLPFRIHASSDQHVVAGVDPDGRVVSLRALHRLLLSGTGDYLIVVSAPVLDVSPGPGSESQPGLRRGQILWAGFSSKKKLLSADATLRPGPAAPFLPMRLEAHLDGNRYTLTVTNATLTSELSFAGAASPAELARLLDLTRRDSLSGGKLTSAYVSIDGLVTARGERAQIAAPLRVEGKLRFPSAPTSVSGGTVHGRTVTFSLLLGDGQPLSRRVEVRGVRTEPLLHVEARPTVLVRSLVPPGARRWSDAVRRRPLSAAALLKRLLDARMQLVRSDQYQSFLSNPDSTGRNRTVYVYETAVPSVRRTVAGPGQGSGGSGGPLVALLALGGSVLGLGAALVAWANN